MFSTPGARILKFLISRVAAAATAVAVARRHRGVALSRKRKRERERRVEEKARRPSILFGFSLARFLRILWTLLQSPPRFPYFSPDICPIYNVSYTPRRSPDNFSLRALCVCARLCTNTLYVSSLRFLRHCSGCVVITLSFILLFFQFFNNNLLFLLLIVPQFVENISVIIASFNAQVR